MHRLLTGPLTLESVTVPIVGLPDRLIGCRIVQLSDFHFDGKRLSPRLLEAAIEQTNSLKPDLVALTGDFVTKETRPIHHLAAALRALESRYGTCAVLGNHDNITYAGRNTIIQSLQRAGITVLWNQVSDLLGDDFPIVGLADFWSHEFAPEPILETLEPTVPRLVLSHNPDSAAQLQRWRVDLQLSGHTHGGQIVLPGIGVVAPLKDRVQWLTKTALSTMVPYLKPDCWKVVHHWEWASGLHQVGTNQLYVNRGLGTYEPGRLLCPPEITEITLVQGG